MPKLTQRELNARWRMIRPGALYTQNEAVTLLAAGRTAVRDAVRSGAIESRLDGRRRMIMGQALIDWLIRQNAGQAG